MQPWRARGGYDEGVETSLRNSNSGSLDSPDAQWRVGWRLEDTGFGLRCKFIAGNNREQHQRRTRTHALSWFQLQPYELAE